MHPRWPRNGMKHWQHVHVHVHVHALRHWKKESKWFKQS